MQEWLDISGLSVDEAIEVLQGFKYCTDSQILIGRNAGLEVECKILWIRDTTEEEKAIFDRIQKNKEAVALIKERNLFRELAKKYPDLLQSLNSCV